MAIDNAGPSTPPVDTSSMTAQDMGPLNGTAPAGLPPISTPAAVAASTAPMPQGQPSPSQQAMNAATEPMQPGRTPAPEADLPAPGPAKPGLWAAVLQGALNGLAGSAGSKHFGGGLAMGAQGEIAGQQRQLENHFESLKAAESAAKAAQDLKHGDLVNTETQLAIDEQRTRANRLADDRGEVEPYPVSGSTPTEMNSSGIGALNTIKQNNGGSIPQVAVTQSPVGVGDKTDTHEADVWTITLGDVRNHPEKVLPAVNRNRVMNGEAPFPDMKSALAYGNSQMPDKGAVWVQNQGNDSYTTTHSMPKLSGSVTESQAQSATYQHQIDRLKLQKDSNGKVLPEAQDTIDLLNGQKKIVDANTDTLVAADKAKTAREHPEFAAPSAQQKTDAVATISTYGKNDARYQGLIQEARDATTVQDLQKIQARADEFKKGDQMADAQRSFAKTQADIKRSDSVTKELTPVWTKDGFSDTLQQANQLRLAAKQAQSGDGLMTAMLPTMEVLGINMAGKIRRISPTEYDAARTSPELVARWNQMYDAMSSGATTDKLAAQANALADLITNASHDKAVRNSQIIAQSYNLPHNQVSAMDHNGNVTTLDKVEAPANATGYAPDPKTGKQYWHDASGKPLAPRI